MFRSLTKYFIFFALYFCFVQPAWADRVYLKNGNILEGRIVEEKKEFIILEFNLENGSGNTTVLNSQIKSIEKATLSDLKKEKIAVPFKQEEPLSSPKRQEDPEKEYRRTILLFSLIPAGLFVLSFVSLFLSSRIVRAEFSRPLGIKLICFYLNTVNIILILWGLMLVSLAANKVFFDFEGMKLIIFYVFTLGTPVVLSALGIGLFYLKNWARIILIVLLFMGLLGEAFSFLSKKDFAGDFFHGFYQQAAEQASKAGSNLPENPQRLIPFNVNASFIFVSFLLLCALYFFRKGTTKAFSDAAQFKKPTHVSRQGLILCLIIVIISLLVGNKAYQLGWKKFFNSPDLFARPLKSQGAIKTDDRLLRDLKEYRALGFNFYLPAGMEKMAGARADTVTLLDKKTMRVFSLDRMSEMEYRVSRVSLYARWNPVLLSFKVLSAPYLGNLVSLKEVKFEQGEGIMRISEKELSRNYYFILKNKSGDNLSCMFVVPDKDSLLDEKRILAMVSAIK